MWLYPKQPTNRRENETMASKRNKTPSKESPNVFSDGVLVYLKVRAWGATAQLNSEMLPDELPEEIVRAVRDLLTPEGMALLKDYRRVRNEAKGWLYRNSIPFPVDGMVFIPKGLIEKANEVLVEWQAQAFGIRDEFIKVVKKLEKDYSNEYPRFYDPSKYPSDAQLFSRFLFRWTFRIFQPPNSDLQVLSPQQYKEEVSKFKEDVERMKSDTLSIVASSIVERLTSLAKQCEDDAVYTSTVESVDRLLEKVDTVFTGFIDNSSIQKAIKDIRLYMDGTDAEMLRADDDFRGVVGKKMKDITEGIQSTGIKLQRGFEL